MAAEMEETREEMLTRHKKELKELQGKNLAAKKAANKNKSAKKAAEDIAAKCEADLLARHLSELSLFDSSPSANDDSKEEAVEEDGKTATDSRDALKELNKGEQVEGVTADASEGEMGVLAAAAGSAFYKQGKLSKSQRKKSEKLRKEAEEELRREEEKANAGPTLRTQETEQLEAILQEEGFTIRPIAPDGHCMFRAVEDQLARNSTVSTSSIVSNGSPAGDVAILRAATAAFMRGHRDEFLPFVTDFECDKDPADQFEEYCSAMEKEPVWGGQPELKALAGALQRPIHVYSASMPKLIMGDEFSDKAPLRLSFHRHEYAMGEHYNSVVPMDIVAIEGS